MGKLILIYYMGTALCMGCNDYLATVKRAIVAANTTNCCELKLVDVTLDPPTQTAMLQQLPTMRLIDQDGNEVSRLTGYKSVTKVVDWIQWNSQGY